MTDVKISNPRFNFDIENIKRILLELPQTYVGANGLTPLTDDWTTGDFNIIGKSGVYVGLTEPSTTYPGQLWQDTSYEDTTVWIKRRNLDDTDWEDFYSVETTDRTINWTTANSASDIQADIDKIGKHILTGVTITCQFADGTYTLASTLTWSGFYGGGKINIYGNSSDNSLSMTKSVFLDFSGQACSGIYVNDCSVFVNVYYLKVKVTTSTPIFGIYFDRCLVGFVFYCYALGDSDSNGGAILLQFTTAINALNNYVADVKYGIYIWGARVYSNTNDEDAANQPKYGLYAAAAGTIGKNSTQPSGSVANELVASGGEIR